MKGVGETAEEESKKKSAKKLIKKENSPEAQRTARKIIEDKGLKTKEEKLIEDLVKQVKENKDK